MNALKSIFIVSLVVAGALGATGCGSSASTPTTSGAIAVGYAAGEVAPVNGVCSYGTTVQPDGGCGVYGGAVGSTAPNCSLYTSANGCCPQSFTLSNNTCVAASNYACQTGMIASSTYGCQPSTMPTGCSWSASYNGCVGAGTPQYTTYPGWSYQPTGNNAYVWYYTNNAPSSGYIWTGYGWAPGLQAGYYWNPYYGWTYYLY